MSIDDQIEDEKLQYDVNREVAKILALSSGKIDKHKYLTGGEILPSNQRKNTIIVIIIIIIIIEQAKLTYSFLGKAFEKQTKIIEDQENKTNWCFKYFKIKRTRCN